ncbi:eCIS core domain-containing protein [Streptomyces anulatus]|uniref:eCIS core domain-containing protein n=1 Tax=Streptomyces anulatus TaxID=1892 RepID=UPI00364D40DF
MPPLSLTADALRAAQRTVGNATVTAMIARRARLASTQEQLDAGVHEDPHSKHQHGAEQGREAAAQPRAADAVNSALRSTGSRLPASLQREMEARFSGEDFSDVAIHTGTAAQRSTEAVGAEAYTTGARHIVFRSTIDKKTLAHELEHVRQQRAGAVAGTDDGSGLSISDPSDRFEKSAERKAEQVMRGGADTRHSVAEHASNAAHRLMEASAEVQRMPKKKPPKGGNPPVAAAASSKTPFEEIMEYFEGRSEEFKAKKQNEKELILENIGIEPGGELFALDDVKGDESILTELLKGIEDAKHASGFAGMGGGKSDWATSAVTSAHSEMRAKYTYWGDKTTLHHKISRSELDAVLVSAERDKANAKPLFDFLDKIRETLGSTAANKKALHNMPANLEMGPASDTRVGDPGSGADFNYTPLGAMTPRSSELNEALSLANAPAVDWEAVASKLRKAQRLHEEQHGGAILSQPARERWKEVGVKWKKASD